jgi:hypothetical protein
VNRILVASFAVATLLTGCATAPSPAQSNACPMCGKPVSDGPEVRVQVDGRVGPGTRYRCFLCPIQEGKSGRSWTMRAVSGLDGRPVTFRVDEGRVSSDPPTAVVLWMPVRPGDECLDVHRVFVDETEFQRYVAAHPALAGTPPKKFEDVIATTAR